MSKLIIVIVLLFSLFELKCQEINKSEIIKNIDSLQTILGTLGQDDYEKNRLTISGSPVYLLLFTYLNLSLDYDRKLFNIINDNNANLSVGIKVGGAYYYRYSVLYPVLLYHVNGSGYYSMVNFESVFKDRHSNYKDELILQLSFGGCRVRKVGHEKDSPNNKITEFNFAKYEICGLLSGYYKMHKSNVVFGGSAGWLLNTIYLRASLGYEF